MNKLILAAALLAVSTTTQATYKGNFIAEYAAAYRAPEQAPTTLAQFLADHPGPAGTPDAAIANYLHLTYAPDMPEAEFYKSIGYDPSWVSRLETLLNSHIKIVVSH